MRRKKLIIIICIMLILAACNKNEPEYYLSNVDFVTNMNSQHKETIGSEHTTASPIAGNTNYICYVDNSYKLICYEIETGMEKVLKEDFRPLNDDLYEIKIYGNYLFYREREGKNSSYPHDNIMKINLLSNKVDKVTDIQEDSPYYLEQDKVYFDDSFDLPEGVYFEYGYIIINEVFYQFDSEKKSIFKYDIKNKVSKYIQFKEHSDINYMLFFSNSEQVYFIYDNCLYRIAEDDTIINLIKFKYDISDFTPTLIIFDEYLFISGGGNQVIYDLDGNYICKFADNEEVVCGPYSVNGYLYFRLPNYSPTGSGSIIESELSAYLKSIGDQYFLFDYEKAIAMNRERSQ